MLDTITLAFRKCPRLKNLIIECFAWQDVTNLNGKQGRFLRAVEAVVPDRRKSSYGWYLESMQFNIWDILKTVHDTKGSLNSLSLLDRNIQCPQDWDVPTTTIFQNLRHLRDFSTNLRILPSIIACAPALESLGIDRGFGFFQRSLQSLIGESVLQNLRACSINRMFFQEDDLVQFLLRHSDTLQDLRISKHPQVYSMDWNSFLNRVRGQLPVLKLRENSRGPWMQQKYWQGVDVFTAADMLQDQEHGQEASLMEMEDGLWEDYEKFFFPEKCES
jgi:hypothetical protein